MSDNTTLNPGVGGDVVRDFAHETAPGVAGNAKIQVMALDVGGVSGSEAIVSPTTSLPTSEKNANIDTPLSVAVVGDVTGDFAGQAILEQVVDDNTGLYLNVKTVNKPPLTDTRGATVISDAPTSIYIGFNGNVQSSQAIDTSGYSVLQVQTYSSFSATIQTSNDGVVWAASQILAYSTVTATALVTNLSGSNQYLIPCVAKYIRFISTTATPCTAVVVLRTGTFPQLLGSPGAAVNVTQLAGTSVLSPGVGGALAVGGVAANSAAATQVNAGNPIMIAGVEVSPVGVAAPGTPQVRRLIADSAGALYVNPTPQQNPNLAITIPLAPQPTAQSPLDPTGVDGMVGALNKIVQYLASIDFLLRELPMTLTNAMNSTVATRSSTVGIAADLDEFMLFRDDPTNFNS